MKKIILAITSLAAIGFLEKGELAAEDWPVWRYDAGHTAASPHELPNDLQLQWVRKYPAPHRAWMEPINQQRMPYDRCYEPIVIGKTLYVGSSREDCLIAIDTETGRERWRYEVDGPVRLPAASWQGKIYFASDDGYLYCVDGKTGVLAWRFSGGPSDRKVLGNERLISAWPARGGPVVADNTVYFAAGIWPFMGVFIHALDAATGRPVWTNDTSGSTFLLQPKRAPAFAGVGPQGSLAINGDLLLVPGGRTVPAVYNRRTGEFLYFNHEGYHKDGTVTHRVSYRRMRYTGSSIVATAGKYFFCDGYMFDAATGADLKRVGKVQRILHEGMMYLAGNPLQAIDLSTLRPSDKVIQRGVQEYDYDLLWSTPFIDSNATIKAGSRLYATGEGEVIALDLPSEKVPARVSWREKIEGSGSSVVAADGKLFVSTAEGRIYCFGRHSKNPVVTQAVRSSENKQTISAAIETTGVREGYCLVFGSSNVEQIQGLSEHSQLRIIVIEPDRQRMIAFREQLRHAKLLPPQVSVMTLDPLSELLPPYLASLIVCDGPLNSDIKSEVDYQQMAARIFHCLRPYGGVACLKLNQQQRAKLLDACTAAKLPGAKIRESDGYTLLSREGPLPGAGSWTHQYADAGNTNVSADARVKLPLGVLWFGGSSHDATLPRHGRPPAPQILDGRIVVEGPNGLRAIDAFTGRVLWDAQLPELGKFFNTVIHQPGVVAVGGNYVTTPDGIYVAHGNKCVRLEPSSGKPVAEFALPRSVQDERPAWSYLNVIGEFLIAGAEPSTFDGSKGIPGESGNLDHTSSRRLVVLNRHAGTVLWQRPAGMAYRHNTIAASDDSLFFIDSLPERELTRLQRRGKEPVGKPQLSAVDLSTGRERWRADGAVGQWLGYSPRHDVVVMSGGSQATAFRGKSGDLLWRKSIPAGSYRFMLHGDRIITQTNAFSLLTGDSINFRDPISGRDVPWLYARNGEIGCTNAVACQNLITFRSGSVGYFDLERGGMGMLGGFRPSCTNNVIAADGLLLAPDYTRTCKCAYQNQTSLALIHMPEVENWTEFGYPPPTAPVKRLGINFGAPGDRLAKDGTMWIEYPTVGGRSPDFGIKVEPKDVRFFRQHESTVKTAALPWVAASGASGLREFRIRLVPHEEEQANTASSTNYTVRIYFAPTEKSKPGEANCDMELQGKTVLKDFDVTTEATDGIAVKQFQNIMVRNELQLAIKPLNKSQALPVVCGIEFISEVREP